MMPGEMLPPSGEPKPVAVSNNPATVILVNALNALVQETRKVWQELRRGNPDTLGVFRITPVGSPAGEGVRSLGTDLRVKDWIISVSAAGTYGLMVGTANRISVNLPAAGLFIIPLPVFINHAASVTTSGTAAQIVDSLLSGWTD